MELLKRKPNFFEEEMDSYPYTNDELDYFGPWIGDFGDYMEPTWQRLYMMACNASLGHVRSNLASWTPQGSWDHQGSQSTSENSDLKSPWSPATAPASDNNSHW